jgi:hypothetical protein
MKRLPVFVLSFVFVLEFIFVPSAWADRKITVAQLEELLRSMQKEKKADVDFATALKQVELSEQLTRITMNRVVQLAPGPQTTEQIYVLEARSATLPPPPSDLPSTPAPDSAATQAILAKASNYVARVYSALPSLAANRTTLRFQDNVEAVGPSSGITGSATEVVTSAGFSNAASFVHYINSSASRMVLEHGAEKPSAEIDKTKWGANKMIAIQSRDPSLAQVFEAAQQSASLQFLRWELINGKPAAVFSFAVPQKASNLDLKVCCFPKIDQQGIAHFYNSSTAAAFGGTGNGGGVSGDWQTTTDWHDFHSIVPYHGEFFIDPESGVVLRMITQAELKPSDVVHQVDTRIDYGPIKSADRIFIVPVKSFVNTVVVPYGESGARIYTTRCTLFTSEYSGYQPQ